MLDRRTFLKTLAASAAVSPLARATASQSPAPATPFATKIHKSVLISMLPKELSYADRFALARDIGFEAIDLMASPQFDVCVRYLKESPWERIRLMRAAF